MDDRDDSLRVALGVRRPQSRRGPARGGRPIGSSADEFARHLASELARFSRVIKDAGIRIE